MHAAAALVAAWMTHSPEDEIRMCHEVRYALEHTSRLEDERWKCDLGEVHADSMMFVRGDIAEGGAVRRCQESEQVGRTSAVR